MCGKTRWSQLFACSLLGWALLLCGLETPLNAEIQVPSNVEPYQPIVIKVSPAGIPANAQVRGSVQCSSASLLEGPSEGVWHCWAAPGKHSVKASGVWVLTQSVELNGQSISVLVDFGQYSESAEFVVGEGEEPVPVPTPTPTPKKKWLVVLEETATRTPEQANLYALIRAKLTSRIVLLDRDAESERVQQYVGHLDATNKLPVLFVVDEDGTVLHQVELPKTYEEIQELLQ